MTVRKKGTREYRQHKSATNARCDLCGNERGKDSPDGLCSRCRELKETAARIRQEQGVMNYLVEHFDSIQKIVEYFEEAVTRRRR